MKFFRKVKDWICHYIEHLFHKKDISDLVPSLKQVNSEKIFASIQPGDIIIATTCQTYDELQKVPEGHRLRPMIVAKKDDEYVYAFSGSSRNKHYRIMFVLDGKKYNNAKDGYVNLSEVKKIPKGNIQYNKCNLTLLDQLKINDLIWNGTHNSKMQYIVLNADLQKGQIVRKDNRLYYLTEIEANTGIVYEMHRCNGSFDEIQIPFGKQVYTVSSSKHEEKLSELIPTSVIEKGVLSNLKTKEKQAKKELQKEKKLQKTNLCQNHSYRYVAGRVFILDYDPYIYLFSNGNHDYGVRKYGKDEEYDYVNLVRLNDLDNCADMEEIIGDEELYETVCELVSFHQQYQWLLEELFVVE